MAWRLGVAYFQTVPSKAGERPGPKRAAWLAPLADEAGSRRGRQAATRAAGAAMIVDGVANGVAWRCQVAEKQWLCHRWGVLRLELLCKNRSRQPFDWPHDRLL